MINQSKYSLVYIDGKLKLVDYCQKGLKLIPIGDGVVSNSKEITICDDGNYHFVVNRVGEKVYLFHLSKEYLIERGILTDEAKQIQEDINGNRMYRNVTAHHQKDSYDDNPENILVCSNREHLTIHGKESKPYNSERMVEMNRVKELNEKRQSSHRLNGNYKYDKSFVDKPESQWSGREKTQHKNRLNGNNKRFRDLTIESNKDEGLKVKRIIGKAFSVIGLCEKMSMPVNKLTYEKVRLDVYPNFPGFGYLNNRFSFDRVLKCYNHQVSLEDIVRTALKNAEVKDKELSR